MPDLNNTLNVIRSLFDACWPNDRDCDAGALIARAGSGICCYYECLHGLSSDAGAMRLIHVLPGHIERGAVQYDVVVDGLIQGDEEPKPILEPLTITTADDSIPQHEPITFGKLEIKALATESSKYHELLFCYKVLLPNLSAFIIGPKRLCTIVLGRTGGMSCYGGGKCQDRLAFPCHSVQKGTDVDGGIQGLRSNDRNAVCLWSIREDLARCVAIALLSPRYDHALFIRREECLPCCTETILRESANFTRVEQDALHVTHII